MDIARNGVQTATKVIAHEVEPSTLYGSYHAMSHAVWALAALTAFCELLFRDYLTVSGWIVLLAVATGIHFFGSMALPFKAQRGFSGFNLSRPLRIAQYIPSIWHIGAGLLSRVMALIAVCIFDYHHDDVAQFNANRYGNRDLASGDVLMYIQWFAFMVFIVAAFLVDTVHFARALDRFSDPRWNYANNRRSREQIPLV